jgi:hypothetical protein
MRISAVDWDLDVPFSWNSLRRRAIAYPRHSGISVGYLHREDVKKVGQIGNAMVIYRVNPYSLANLPC